MSQRNIHITFESSDVIEPFYTGGPISIDRQGNLLATCLGQIVILSDLRNGKLLARLDGDDEAVTTLDLTPSGTHLVVCSRSLAMRIYALEFLENGSEILPKLERTLKPFATPVVASSIDESGSLLATGSADGVVKVWNLEGGYVSHNLKGHSGVVSCLKFFQDSAAEGAGQDPFRLASGGEDGQLRIWDLVKGKLLKRIDDHSSAITGIDYSAEENILISGSRDQTLAIWDGSTWKEQRRLPMLETIESVGILQGGRTAYCGGEGAKVRFCDLVTGKEIMTVDEHQGADSSLIRILYPPGGNFLLCAKDNYLLEIRDTSTIQAYIPGRKAVELPLIRQLSGTHDEVIDLAFVGPQKHLMALATNTESVKLVNVRHLETPDEEEEEEHKLSFGSDIAVLEGHEDIILCLDAHPSGCWLATGAKDNTARLWRYDPQMQTFDCITVLTGHAGSIGGIALTHDDLQPEAAILESRDRLPRFLITGSQDKTVKKWDLKQDLELDEPFKQSRATYTRKAHEKDINALTIDADSRFFASASQDKLVKIWSVEDGEVQGVLRGHKRGVWSVSFAPRGTPAISGDAGQESSKRGYILTGSGDRTIKIWSLSSFECLRSFEGHINSILKVVWIPPPDVSATDTSFKRPYLVASAGADGLVKVWNTQNSECLCTLDNHTERVWALGFDSLSQRLVSGGGDGVITFWKDTTEETMATTAAESTARIEQEQQLMNHVHRGNYRDAIILALQLNHPARLLSLLSDVVKTSPPEEGSLCGVKAVDKVIAELNEDQLFILILRLRDWNANARTAVVAQKILWVVFKTFPASTLVNLKKNGKGLGDVLAGLQAYTDRHFRRTDELLEESYLIDFVVRSMDQSGFVDSQHGGLNGVLVHKEQVMIE